MVTGETAAEELANVEALLCERTKGNKEVLSGKPALEGDGPGVAVNSLSKVSADILEPLGWSKRVLEETNADSKSRAGSGEADDDTEGEFAREATFEKESDATGELRCEEAAELATRVALDLARALLNTVDKTAHL